MRYWVGVTDNSWFEFLRREAPDEVNFWQPSGKPPFTNLEPGAPFLFKLKSPHNHIAGGAFFVKFSTLPMSMVWDVFGRKNGAAQRAEFEGMIRRLASDKTARDPYVGCTVLSDPFFWAPDLWIPAGPYWKSNVVVGSYFDSQDERGARLWAEVQARQSLPLVAEYEAEHERYGKPILVRPRLGQSGFQVVVTDAYQRRCAITGERTLPVLEAAHILPYAEKGPHDLRNGLLLRSDFHKLFDKGLVTITPDLNVEVSPKIREEWFNGKAYYRLHGQRVVNLPPDPEQHPSRTFLQWHNENRFQG
ncbi:MAG TPA: HNH endonuclease [Terriglobales bacterium]|nr:HNH endonuclease [Terriglobales bacterium]